MPTFGAYPALQTQTFNLPEIMRQAEQLKGQRTMNRLREMQVGQAQAEQGRQTQLRGIMPQVMAGDPGALGQAASLDPSMMGQLLKIPKAQRDQLKEKVGQIADLLAPFADPGVPEIQKSQMWAQTLQRAQEMGLPVENAPSNYDPNWVSMKISEAGQYKNALDQADKAPKIETFYTAKGGSQKRQWNPESKEWESIGGIKPPSGMSIRVNKDGTIEFVQGPGAGMQRKTLGDIEEKLVGAREGLSRLRNIAAKFKPEFQEIPTRVGVAWTGLKARFGGGGISSEDRQALTEFADYRRGAISNINLYIKEITGAQMSEAEADRLRLAQPDPGEGIFGGDDPITFKAKLDSAVQDLEKAAVRYEHYLNKGITDPEDFARLSPLDTIRTAINEQTGERLVKIGGQWVPLQ